MTLDDLAIQLRGLAAKMSKEPLWNPKTALLIDVQPGRIDLSGPYREVGSLFLDAYRSGALSGRYFEDLCAALLRPAALNDFRDAALITLTWLHQKKHSVAGTDPRADPLERLALVIEAISKSLNQRRSHHPRMSEGEQDREVAQLKDRHANALEAMIALNATVYDRRQTAEKIAVKAEGAGTNGDKYKRPLADLVRWGYAESEAGRNGGCWITAAGEAALKEHNQSGK